MNPKEQQQFAQQLALWTELTIENGRTPFRRVDLYPEIYTDKGLIKPPLVFWINRQSMMAGGILLLPEQNLEAEKERGRSCCDALGLKHFVTWENDRVRIWQLDDGSILKYQQFSFQHADHPDSFRHLLGTVLETLKLLAVIGLVPAAELSPHYLHNLFQTTLDLALPALVNSYRGQRAVEEVSAAEDADLLAREANRLLLLQLLGLVWHQQLPTAILPEKLERAIQLSLPQLPQPLQPSLSLRVSNTSPALPLETAICFHHLLLRLRQLSWRETPQRAITSIQLVIESWHAGQHLPQPAADVQLYPMNPDQDPKTQLILSDSASLLAAAGLLQDLLQQPQKQLLHGNLFQLDFAGRSGLSISGRLDNQRLLPRQERQQYAALLRTSWPHRRFRIGGDKPLWFWELIHLLGLSKNQQKIDLVLPLAALKGSVTEPFWSLLEANYAIQQVRLLSAESIFLELRPATAAVDLITVQRDNETRTLPGGTELQVLRSHLLLAVSLPAEIYQLLGNKLVWPKEEKLDGEAAAGMQIYMQSRLMRLFRKILGDNPQADQDTLMQQPHSTWPRPDYLHLKELARADKTKLRQRSDPDRLLADLLQVPVVESSEVKADIQSRASAPSRKSTQSLQLKLMQQLQREGIPVFPEQHLYFLDQPEMVSYHMTPPLTVKSELLGEIELEDAAGRGFQVYGEELADALLLCSKLGRTEFELPVDRQQLALLQQHYWNDIKGLHKRLNSLCHSHVKNPNEAKKLTRKIWKKLNLPEL